MRAIHAWLVEEEELGIEGNFLCNWGLTESCHRDGEVIVYLDGATGVPVAYQWGGLLQSGILQVRHDMRGRGIGKKLVNHRIRQAVACDETILFIQCKPSSSIPFWTRMGFVPFRSDDGNTYAHRILEKRHTLPEGRGAKVVIRLYPERKKWDDGVAPYDVKVPAAVTDKEGVTHLAERVHYAERPGTRSNDLVIELEIDGEVRYCDKAKYPEAQVFGVRRCKQGFFIDRIDPAHV